MTRIRPLNITLIVIAIIICISFYVGLPYLTTKSSVIGIIILLVCLLTILGLIWYLSTEDNKELKKELKKEFIYIFHDSTIAWIIGLWLGSIIIGTVLLFFGLTEYTHAEINPSAFDIVSIYVGSVLGVLAIRAFYETLHPIYEELDLINKITKDLNEVKGNVEIWFSFPGLNLCEFRIETSAVVDGNDFFKKYKEALTNKINDRNIRFHGICYGDSNIEKLFDKYGEINKINGSNSSTIDTAIATCKETAKKFVADIKSAQTLNHQSNHYEMLPENPVESFVIIGDIVYTIQAWGLPVFKNGNFEDPFKGRRPEDNKKLVRLIAYRQHDGELAKTITERTRTIVAL